MLIRHTNETTGTPMSMDGVKDVTMRLMVGRDDGAPNFAMRHFTVAPGGHTPRHQHNYEHEVFILEGEGQVEENGRLRDIAAGNAVYIMPNVMHQFVNTGPSPLKFLCMVPVSFDCGSEGRRPTPGS